MFDMISHLSVHLHLCLYLQNKPENALFYELYLKSFQIMYALTSVLVVAPQEQLPECTAVGLVEAVAAA